MQPDLFGALEIRSNLGGQRLCRIELAFGPDSLGDLQFYLAAIDIAVKVEDMRFNSTFAVRRMSAASRYW